MKFLDQYKELSKVANKSYHTFPIIKKSGKKRWIDAPSSELKRAQAVILRKFLYKFSPHSAAVGFVKKLSVKDGAQKHIGARFVINLDISDFFNSIKKHRVLRLMHSLLARYIESNPELCGMSETEKKNYINNYRDILVSLCIYKNRVPQGARTSPAIANLIAIPLDIALSDYAASHNMIYSRYADDLTFSGEQRIEVASVISDITKIINSHNFKVNPNKTSFKSNGNRMMVTGVVINKKLGIPRYKKRQFRAKLNNIIKTEKPVSKTEFQKIRGYTEWVRSLNPIVGNQFLQQVGRLQIVPSVQ